MTLLFLFLISQEANTLYLMDESWTVFPAREETLFTSSKNAMRTVQGCLDLDRWYQRYEVKLETRLFSRIFMKYDLDKEDDYDLKEENHVFTLRWLPEEDKGLPLTYSFFISPQHLKVHDFTGMGIGYWENRRNNHRLNFILYDFDHNYSLSKKSNPEESPYTRFPLGIKLEGNIRNQWSYLSYSYEWIVRGKKEFRINDEITGRGEYGAKSLYINTHYYPFNIITAGFYLKYYRQDSINVIYEGNDYEYELEHLFAEPFVEFKIFENNRIYLGFPLDYKYKLKDTDEYRRKWYGISVYDMIKVTNWLSVTTGMQKTWRKIEDDSNSETRAVIALDFNFRKSFYFSIKEGVELDLPISSILKSPHNHTFVTLSMIF